MVSCKPALSSIAQMFVAKPLPVQVHLTTPQLNYEVHGKYKNYQFFYRGGDFRKLFSRLGELHSIVPSHINIMALTATATRTLQQEVCFILGMHDYVTVEVSPNKPNIIYLMCDSIMETFDPIAEKLKSE